MSGRTDQDGLPPGFDPVRPGTFEREKVDLDALVYEGDPEAIHRWVEDTMTRHRGQAYAHGVEAGRRQSRVGRTDWGELFPYLPFVLVCLLLVLGVL